MSLSLSITDIQKAAQVLQSAAVKTPLLESDSINDILGGRVLVKAECLQRTGCFKFRGAYYAMSQIPENQKVHGVVAYSSGNHGQAVAYCAKLFNIPATIVIPKDAPHIKIAQAEKYGATLVFFDRQRESREAIGQALMEKTGAYLIPPFDHLHVMAGQGTIGLEIVQQCQELGITPTQILIPTSGGGLAAGCAVAVKHFFPGCSMYAVEPKAYDDLAQSLAKGERVGHTHNEAQSLCDSLMAPMPGELTFAINKVLLEDSLTVEEDSLCPAMKRAFENLKIVLEPSGAIGLAALLEQKIPCQSNVTIVVASGGNVDPYLFAQAITHISGHSSMPKA